MNNSITEWINNPDRIYADGVRLLEAYGGNPNLVRVFANRSPRFAMADLVAEVRRLTPRPVPVTVSKVLPPAPDVPAVAKEAKRLVHEAWVRLSRIHSALFEVGIGNGEKEVAERMRLMKEREPLIERYNSLYGAKEAFFGGRMGEEQLQRVVKGAPLEEVMHPQPEPEGTDVGRLSDVELLKRIKAAKATVTRCKNQLLYQRDTAAAVANPMPECPRRDKVTAKLRKKEAELQQLGVERERRGL